MNDYNDFDLDDYDDYVINNEGLDKIILEKFIPWLKGKDYLDRDNQKY